MPYYQWKKRKIWLGIESVRGTAVAPTYWFPWTDYSFVPKIDVMEDEGNAGTLISSIDSHVTKQWSEGNIGGKVYPNGIVYLLLAALGKKTTNNAGSNPVHTIEVEEVNNHPSLTICTSDPVSDMQYPLWVVDNLQISAETGGDYNVTSTIKAKIGVTPAGAYTPWYVNEEAFTATDIKVYVENNLAALAGATNNICVQRFDITISKETEDIDCLSSLDPIDFMNTSMKIEGNLEMYWTNNDYRDYTMGSIAKAIRIKAVDTSVTLTGAENPEITIDLAKVKFVDWSDAVTLWDIIKQTVKFTAHYSIANSKAISVLVRNTKATY